MYEPNNPITGHAESEDSVFERPRIALLDEKHWYYIQRRYQITARELQIAKLICRGCNNGEVTEALKIKQGTAKTHLRNIYRKIRVRNKIEMLLKFVGDASRFSANFKIAPPAPVLDIEKQPRKAGQLPETTPKNLGS